MTTYTWAILTSAGADAEGVGSTSTGSEAGALSSQVMSECACSPASRARCSLFVVGVDDVESKKKALVW